MTQRDRVLGALRRVGARGIVRPDFMLPGVIDGGPPILNLPARIEELRRAGYAVDAQLDGGLARYTLRAEPSRAAAEPLDDQADAILERLIAKGVVSADGEVVA